MKQVCSSDRVIGGGSSHVRARSGDKPETRGARFPCPHLSQRAGHAHRLRTHLGRTETKQRGKMFRVAAPAWGVACAIDGARPDSTASNFPRMRAPSNAVKAGG